MDKKRIDDIRARVNATTEGEWRFCNESEYRWSICDEHEGEQTFTIISEYGYGVLSTPRSIANSKESDYAFIAHARTDIPDLLDEVEQLKTNLAAITIERDAAVRDLTHMLSRSAVGVCMMYCKNHKPMCGGWDGCYPEWKGVK